MNRQIKGGKFPIFQDQKSKGKEEFRTPGGRGKDSAYCTVAFNHFHDM
jgi:hypothetical protein